MNAAALEERQQLQPPYCAPSTHPHRMFCHSWKLIGIARLVLLCVVVSAAAAQGRADCKVPGFSFRQGQIPNQKGPGAFVGLFTLPYKPQGPSTSVPPTPYPNLAATAAACQADSSCAMFTSDGYLIAAFRASAGFPDEDARAMPEGEAFNWERMRYCERSCCGTWIAQGALDQVLAPLPIGAASSNGQGAVRTITGSNALPRDWGTLDYMNPKLIDTACAGKEYAYQIGNDLKVSCVPADCPQRCRVACCKQLAEGNHNTDSRPDKPDALKLMSWHHFGQCSASVCKPCGFMQGMFTPKIAANSQGNIVMRQYLRAKAAEAAGAPSATQQSKAG